MTKRAIRLHSLDEYGQPFVYLIRPDDIPVFFHNRMNARLTKVEMIDYDEEKLWPDREIVIQSIEEKKNVIENVKAFQHILTAKQIKEEFENSKKVKAQWDTM